MKKLVLLALVSAMLSAPLQADVKSTDVKECAPERYTVKKGDTLWDIANRYLKDAWRWPEIWQANQQVRNPHLIYPGDNLVLCRIEQRAVVAVDEGGGCDQVLANMSMMNKASVSGGSGNVKLVPEIKVEDLSLAIPAIPLKDIRAYLTDSRVFGTEDFDKAPYVLSPGYQRVLAAGQGDLVYIRGKNIPLGESFGLYRKGLRYDDPDTKEYLGFEGEDIATGRITSVQEDIATFEIARNTQEVRIGDRLFATEARAVTPIFFPSNPMGVKNGRIIRIMGSLGTGGLNNVIVINRGERDGVKQGHTFALYQRGAVVTDRVKEELVRLPSERTGLAMVFRTFNKVSYAVILRASTTIKVGDETRPPITGD
jgi:hypothetical protein